MKTYIVTGRPMLALFARNNIERIVAKDEQDAVKQYFHSDGFFHKNYEHEILSITEVK